MMMIFRHDQIQNCLLLVIYLLAMVGCRLD